MESSGSRARLVVPIAILTAVVLAAIVGAVLWNQYAVRIAREQEANRAHQEAAAREAEMRRQLEAEKARLEAEARREQERIEGEERRRNEEAAAAALRREQSLKDARDPELQGELIASFDNACQDIEKLLGTLDTRESTKIIASATRQLKGLRDRAAVHVDHYSRTKLKLDSGERLEYWKNIQPTFKALASELAELRTTLEQERKRVADLVALRNRPVSLGGYLELGGRTFADAGIDIGNGLRVKYAQESVISDQFGVVAGPLELHAARARTEQDADLIEYLNECLVRNVESKLDRFGKPDRSKRGARVGQCERLNVFDAGGSQAGLAAAIELGGKWYTVGVARAGFWCIRLELGGVALDREKAIAQIPQLVGLCKALVGEFTRASRPPLGRVYFPLLKDAKRVYTDDGRGRTVTVVSAENDAGSTRLVMEERFNAGGSAKHVRLITEEGVYYADSVWRGSSPMVLKFSAKVGETWKWPADSSDADVWNIEFVGYESIKVAGGTYECAKIVIKQGDSTQTTWYAPGVGMAKQEYSDSKRRTVLELMAILTDDDYERGLDAGRQASGLLDRETRADLKYASDEMLDRVMNFCFSGGARIYGYDAANASDKFKQGWVDGFKKACGLK